MNSLSRRTVLAGTASAAAATLVAGRASAEGTDNPTNTVPETLARTLSAPEGKAEAAFPLSHLSVSWTGQQTGAGVRLRTAAGWQEWQEAPGCCTGRDDLPADSQYSLIAAPGVVGYELALPAGATAGRVTELNTVDGPRRAVKQVPSRNPVPRSPYLSRSKWGADESKRFDSTGKEIWPPAYFPVQTLTVHHTAGINNDPDPAATVRAIYHEHGIGRGYGDIGYHLMIDEAGRVYEARYSGADPFPVFGQISPEGLPMMVNAGHAVGFNAGNIGVCLLGHFNKQLPTRAAQRSLVYVLAALSVLCDLDPDGTTNYVNPISGAKKTVNTISGHRNWGATDCPGHLFYPELARIRAEVAALTGR
ncbi:peptidoglycan recognition protein family protein [Longispora albida]|uniref:peptidoglycan recognition protein family protein n=1 Tax=Longispora albida TaxID=203523 RepID=UPI00036FA0EC|nr:peptidoglycan recognition family protein [Longispora albida]